MDSKKIAIVTGASSGIGLAISKKLISLGYTVHGIGRDFSNAKSLLESDVFTAHCLDLLDTNSLVSLVNQIDADSTVSLLVNNAGVGYYGLHESLSTDDISTMVRTNLEVPMILTNLLLKSLKKNDGYVINISSHTASKANPHGVAYGATKAGLSSFSKSLFEEERKYGLKVINIEPDMANTNLYRSASFGPDEDIDAYLEPSEIADAVEFALSQRNGCIITQISLEPKLNRISKKTLI